MTYLYDILMNFNDKNTIYEYFDWNNDDLIINVKKVPLFKVDYKTLFELYTYKIKINKSFLKNNKYSYINKKINISNLFIITNGEKSLAIGTNENGIVEYKSTLNYEDEDYANRLSLSLNSISVKYKILTNNCCEYSLRDYKIKKEFLKKEFNKVYKNNETDRLKYYYLEVYDEVIDDVTLIIKRLIEGLDIELNKYDSLYNILKNNTSLIEK